MSAKQNSAPVVKKVATAKSTTFSAKKIVAGKPTGSNSVDHSASNSIGKPKSSAAMKKTSAKKTVAVKDSVPKNKKTSGTGARLH